MVLIYPSGGVSSWCLKKLSEVTLSRVCHTLKIHRRREQQNVSVVTCGERSTVETSFT